MYMRANQCILTLSTLLPLSSFADPSLGHWNTFGAVGTTDSGENWVSATSTAVPLVIPSSILGSYFFRVDAPANVSVPVGVDYYFGGQVSANLGASASMLDTFKIVNIFTDTLSRSINTTGHVTGGVIGQRHRDMQLVGGGIYQVQLLVNATVGGIVTGATNTFSTGYVDPYIAIDSNFLLLHPGYTISFSDGVINAVPEPSSSLLLLVGIGGISAYIRRRSKSSTSQTTTFILHEGDA